MAAGPGQPTSAAQPRGRPAPTRSVEEIGRDIKTERAALESSFVALQRDVQETVEQVRRQVTAAGRRALVIGPVIGVAAGGLMAGIVLLSRRRRDKED
jgi:hypothetical protein